MLLDSLLTKEKILILGDVNVHFDRPQDSDVKRLIEALDSRGLCQLIDKPTHRLGHILDWVITCAPSESLVKSAVVEDFLLSDHFVQSLVTDLSRPRRRKTSVLCRNLKIDLNAFKEDLLQSKLLLDPPTDVDGLAELYNQTLLELLDKHAPAVSKIVVDRPDCAWFCEGLVKPRNRDRLAEKKWRKTKLEIDRQLYKLARNKYVCAVKKAKSLFVQEQLEAASGNLRKTFDIVNSLMGKNGTSPVLPEVDVKSAADQLSSFFVNKITEISAGLESAACELPECEEDYSVPFAGVPLTSFTCIDESYLRKLVARSTKTSCAVDPVPTKFILQLLDILFPVILDIINASLRAGCVPRCFKQAVVKPLLKTANLNPSDCKNYRPVSNLSYISKLLERVVAEQLMTHFITYGCLDKFQSAYRPGFSIETALLHVTNDILCSVNSGNLVLLVLLDLSSAFDTINHRLLLQRLSSEAGIHGAALQWIDSYLAERSQRVIVGSASSEAVPLVCGVPQGSVLGPFLFSVYTSQLGRVIERFQMGRQFFADDTQILNSFPPPPPPRPGSG
ncbi:hypothetical protein C0Q70_20748 [Pomacea canaliculata]|uniref:Reverse transcriptase domain-containing protein n=1 Tax=Pomacea canaliculata TaxID=400727 RepID=A0A2T7NGF3_POMCA|nr:hypothetical protein C0Q70_20748 [Pomacea canaliculata]